MMDDVTPHCTVTLNGDALEGCKIFLVKRGKNAAFQIDNGDGQIIEVEFSMCWPLRSSN